MPCVGILLSPRRALKRLLIWSSSGSAKGSSQRWSLCKFCKKQWRKCIARQQRMKKSYFGYYNDGETFSQSLGLRRHAITQHQLPGAAHATSFIRAEVSSNEISILPTFGWTWARPGILTMGMICNSSCWTWHLLPDPTTLPIPLHPLLSQGFPVWGRYHAPTWLSQCVWRQLLGLKTWSLFTFFLR